MKDSLAVKYRPRDWSDVTEQSSVCTILKNQIDSGNICHSLLFIGSAGTGKTTCARIYANNVNQGKGSAIELDAASNNGVDDVRNIIQQAQTKSLDSEYKCFILDEVHALSNNAWQALLKLIEEPPAKSIFIFCTTNPEKVPKTIISRVQQYTFSKISHEGIVHRLSTVLKSEFGNDYAIDFEAISYISKLSEGGMRDALTLLDKCLAYSDVINIENVVKALGTVDYSTMITLTDNYINNDVKAVMSCLNDIYNSGKDIKQFMKSYTYFLFDILKYYWGCDWNLLTIPRLSEYEAFMKNIKLEGCDNVYDRCVELASACSTLNSSLKYSSSPKLDIESMFMLKMI